MAAPFTGDIEYVFELAGHMVALPEMAPVMSGKLLMVTFKVLAPEDPQVLLALTLILPPIVPAVAVIEFIVELPVHPDGNVQL